MRSFLARLDRSATRVVPHTIWLLTLLCSACVTSFPLDELEMDMTMAQATHAFGEPSSTSSESIAELQQAVLRLREQNTQIYESLEALDLGETRDPTAQRLERLSNDTLRTLERFVVALDEESGGRLVMSTWVYPHEELVWAWWLVYPVSIAVLGIPFLDDIHVEKHEVDLVFEGDRLIRWETRLGPPRPTDTYYTHNYDPFPSTQTWFPKPTKSAPPPPPPPPVAAPPPRRSPVPQHDHEAGPKNPSRR